MSTTTAADYDLRIIKKICSAMQKPDAHHNKARMILSNLVASAMEEARVHVTVLKFRNALTLNGVDHLRSNIVKMSKSPKVFQATVPVLQRMQVTTARMHMATSHPRVLVAVPTQAEKALLAPAPSSGNESCEEWLHLKPGGATICFEFHGLGAKKKDFIPVGIAFAAMDSIVNTPQKVATAARRLVQLNTAQSQIHVEGNCLYLTDHFKEVDGDCRFEFFLVVQDTKLGQLGIIDPPIVHDPGTQPW